MGTRLKTLSNVRPRSAAASLESEQELARQRAIFFYNTVSAQNREVYTAEIVIHTLGILFLLDNTTHGLSMGFSS